MTFPRQLTSSHNAGGFKMLHSEAPEPTTWDLFICVAGRPEGIALTRLAHVLGVEKERSLIRPLSELVDSGLLDEVGADRYQLANNKKASILKLTLSYALAYGYDYNAYFEPNMIEFLRQAYRGEYFTSSDVDRELLKHPGIVARLVHNDLLLVYYFKEFQGKLIPNPFLDGICEFLEIKKAKSFFVFMRKKKDIDAILRNNLEVLEDPNHPEIKAVKTRLGDSGLTDQGWGLGHFGSLIKDSVEKEDTELFDPESSRCYNAAMDKMHKNVDENVPLNMDTLREYHRLAMANTDFAGVLRDHEVFVRNNSHFKTANPADIPHLLEEWVNMGLASKPINMNEVFEVAAFMYSQLIHIHPFEDGNSRTARIVLAHILKANKVPFILIPQSYEVRFLQVTKGYKKRDDNELKYLLEEIYLNYINRLELDMARKLKD